MKDSEMKSLECGITPESMERLVRQIEAKQRAVNRGTVTLGEVLDSLLGGTALTPRERSTLESRLRKAIVRAVEQSPALGFAGGG